MDGTTPRHTSAEEVNREVWNRIARRGNSYYKAVSAEEIDNARHGKFKIRVTPIKYVPVRWQGPVKGKNVLCLASGGGQQAPLFSAAGANTTVFDISEHQLERDKELAARHNLKLDLVAGDMADLSCLASNHFDLIVNPCSTCFCSTLQPIWQEVHRVLRHGGKFITGFIQPINFLFDQIKLQNGELKVTNRIPYCDLDLDESTRSKILGDERPVEFGHSLTDLIGGQISAGLQILDFYEDQWGDNDPLSDYIDLFAATLATKTH